MKAVSPSDRRRHRTFQKREPQQKDPAEMLEILLALDRSIVEVSMQLYNVDQSDRRTMRAQNGRLHDAFRTQFPRFLKAARKNG
jgi:hypothetical protein